MTFTWRMEPAGDAEQLPDMPVSFSNQGDAESWIGEFYPALADAGVENVTLISDGATVYSMSLLPE